MAFRDDREALRHEIRELRKTVDATTDELDSKKVELKKLGEEIDHEVKEKSGVLIGVLIVFGIFVAVFVLITVINMNSESTTRTVYGRVTAVTGSMDLEAGDRCTVWLTSGGKNWDAQVSVLCNGTVLYDDGLMDCPDDNDYARCRDLDYSANGGDPAIDIDRSQRRVQIREENPNWYVDIALGREADGV